MKKTIIAIFILLLAGVVTSWTLGNTISPSDFANVDLDKHDFNPTPTGNKIIGSGQGSLIGANVQIDSYEKQADLSFEETNKTITGLVDIRQFVSCMAAGGNEQECKVQVKTGLIANIVQRIKSEKTMLESDQEEAKNFAQYADLLQAGDITITQQEIEAELNK